MDRAFSPLRAAGLAAVDGAAIWRLWPDLSALRRDLAEPRAWLARVGADAAAGTFVAALLWLVALWLALGLAAALLGYLPGAAGAAGRRWAAIALPRALYRAAVGAAGLGVLLTPVAAGAMPTHSSDPPITAPTGGPGARAGDAGAGAIGTAPTGGPGARAGDEGAGAIGTSVPSPVWPTSTTPAPPAGPRHEAEPESSDVVVVRAGDSLWRIAAAHLPPHASERRIATTWPNWYAANRAVIGADPDRILPGQRLHPPTDQEPL